VKPTYSDLDASFSERTRNVEGTGILVGLNTDEGDQSEIAVMPQTGQEARDDDPRVRLINRLDIDGDIRSKNLAFGAIGGDAVNSRKRVRRDHRAPPADDVAIIVVVRRFDQDELEAPLSGLRKVPQGRRLRIVRSRLVVLL
jgi:hypothetical protein